MSSLRPVTGTAEEILALLRAWDAEADPEPLVIETSGSTGRPKRVLLSRAAMRASALATHARLGGPGRWVLNLPPGYVAGVQVLYRSVVAGVDPVVPDGEVPRAPAGRAYLSLVPTQLSRAIAQEADPSWGRALAEFDAVLVGGGPLAPRLRAAAEARDIRIVSTYGMSETCGGCVYDGRPLAGVEVRIDTGGQVLLRGPMLFDGYEGDPERTEHALRDGWFQTDDLGELDDDGRLRLLGRVDDMIISGGLKVPAHAVAAMIAAAPGVRAAEVIGVADAEWGEVVVAVVAAQSELTLAAVRSLVQPRAWAPRRLVQVEQMPLLGNGKTDRTALRRLVDGG